MSCGVGRPGHRATAPTCHPGHPGQLIGACKAGRGQQAVVVRLWRKIAPVSAAAYNRSSSVSQQREPCACKQPAAAAVDVRCSGGTGGGGGGAPKTQAAAATITTSSPKLSMVQAAAGRGSSRGEQAADSGAVLGCCRAAGGRRQAAAAAAAAASSSQSGRHGARQDDLVTSPCSVRGCTGPGQRPNAPKHPRSSRRLRRPPAAPAACRADRGPGFGGRMALHAHILAAASWR